MKSKMIFQGTNSLSIKKYSNEYFGERIELFSAFVSDFSTLKSIKRAIENTLIVCITVIKKSVYCTFSINYTLLVKDFVSLVKGFISLVKDFINLVKDFVSLVKDFIRLVKDFISLVKDFIRLVKGFISLVKDFIRLQTGFISL